MKWTKWPIFGAVTPRTCLDRDSVQDLQELLDQGLDINQVDADGRTILHWAAVKGQEEVVSKLLNQRSLELQVQDKDGKTALHLAAATGGLTVLDGLKEKINLTASDNNGSLALHEAVEKGHSDCVKALLEADPDGETLDVKDSRGRTALK